MEHALWNMNSSKAEIISTRSLFCDLSNKTKLSIPFFKMKDLSLDQTFTVSQCSICSFHNSTRAYVQTSKKAKTYIRFVKDCGKETICLLNCSRLFLNMSITALIENIDVNIDGKNRLIPWFKIILLDTDTLREVEELLCTQLQSSIY